MERPLEEMRFPLGRFQMPADPIAEAEALIAQIEELPTRLQAAVAGLSDEQLDTPYRPDGWTVRQVVHHVADSHLNSYMRFKLAATEEVPDVKLYDEKLWADLSDARQAPVELSLTLLDVLHRRWVLFLRSLEETQLGRGFRHPDYGTLTVAQNIAIYAWHGRHHVEHITGLRRRRGWA